MSKINEFHVTSWQLFGGCSQPQLLAASSTFRPVENPARLHDIPARPASSTLPAPGSKRRPKGARPGSAPQRALAHDRNILLPRRSQARHGDGAPPDSEHTTHSRTPTMSSASAKFEIGALFDVKGKVVLVTGGSRGIGKMVRFVPLVASYMPL